MNRATLALSLAVLAALPAFSSAQTKPKGKDDVYVAPKPWGNEWKAWEAHCKKATSCEQKDYNKWYQEWVKTHPRKYAPNTTTVQTTPKTDNKTSENTCTGESCTKPKEETACTGETCTDPNTTGTGTTQPEKGLIQQHLENSQTMNQLGNANQEGGVKESKTYDGTDPNAPVVDPNAGKTGTGTTGTGTSTPVQYTDSPNKSYSQNYVGPQAPESTKAETKCKLWDKIRKKCANEPGTGDIQGIAIKTPNKDFPNLVGGGKTAVYSSLLAAMFLTGPGAIVGIALFGIVGFFAGYWATKKNS